MSSLNATTLFALTGGAMSSTGTASLNSSLRSSMLVQTSGVQSLPAPPGGPNSDIFIRVATTNADPDHNIMVLANAAPSTLPSYLTDSPASFDQNDPGIFPIGIQVGRDLYISRIAESVSFATGLVSLAPEQITGGANDLAGTTIALATNSCPDMRDFTLSSLQGSVDRPDDFKTSPLCPAAIIANGFEDRENVMTQRYREGGAVQVSVTTPLTRGNPQISAVSTLDYLGKPGSTGTIPSWQTAPVTVSGSVTLVLSDGAAATVVTGTITVSWGYISPIDGKVNIVEQTSTTNTRPGTGTGSHFLSFPQTIFNNPTAGLDGSGFSSVLLAVRVVLVIQGAGTFANATIPANFALVYHGRKPSNQENVSVIGIVGGYEGRAMLRHNMSYEIQPTRETLPLLRSSLRPAHTTAERDNYLSVRNRLWGGTSSFTMLDTQISSYIDIIRTGKALSLYMNGLSPSSFGDSPANGTLTPYYSASSLNERFAHANRGGPGVLESLYQSLCDSKHSNHQGNRFDSFSRPAPTGKYLASSKDSDWESFLNPREPHDTRQSAHVTHTVEVKSTHENSKDQHSTTSVITDEKKDKPRITSVEVTTPAKVVYRAMVLNGLSTPSINKRQREGEPTLGDAKDLFAETMVVLLPARVGIDPSVVKLAERKMGMPIPQIGFSDKKTYHAMENPDANDVNMGDVTVPPESVKTESDPPPTRVLDTEMSEVSAVPPLNDLRLAGYTFSRMTTNLLRPVSTMMYVHHGYAGHAVNCLHPTHVFMKGRTTTSYQLFPAVFTEPDNKMMALMAIILSIEPLGLNSKINQTYIKVPMRQRFVYCDVHVGSEFTTESRRAITNTLSYLFYQRPPVIGVDIYVSGRGFSDYDNEIIADNSMLLALGLAYYGAPTIASTGNLVDGMVGGVGDIGPKKACFSDDSADRCWKIPFAYPYNGSRDDQPWCRGVTSFASALDFACASYAGAVFKDRNLPSTLKSLAAYNEYSAVVKRRIFTKALADVQTYYAEIQGDTGRVNTLIGELASQTESLGTFRDSDVTSENIEKRLEKKADPNQEKARAAEAKLVAERNRRYEEVYDALTAKGYHTVTREWPESSGKFQGAIGRDIAVAAKQRWGRVTSGEYVIRGVFISKDDLKQYRTGTSGAGAARLALSESSPQSFNIHFGVNINKTDETKPALVVVYWVIPLTDKAAEPAKTFKISTKKKKKASDTKRKTSVDEDAIASFLAIPEATE